jgi:hypothetical protein
MHEVLQLSDEELIGTIQKLRNLQKDYWSHIAATDEIWATIIEDFPEMIPFIVKDMRYRAAQIRKLVEKTNET